MKFDITLYRQIMSHPEGLPHKEYKKALGKYVSTMDEGEKEDILSRRDEICEAEAEWRELNNSVLLRLGFSDSEADMLDDKRLDSPGMRNVLRNRMEEVRAAKRVGVR